MTMASVAPAHEGLDARIAELTQRLSSGDGETGQLLLDRADLFEREGAWHLALADLEAARARIGRPPRARGITARILARKGHLPESIRELDLALQVEPHARNLRRLRAQQCARLGQIDQALADYDSLIESAELPIPGDVIARSMVHAELEPETRDRALHGLDRAMERLGTLPTLVLCAVEHERARGNFEGALTRIDMLMASMRRKETWWVRRGDLLLEAGRLAEARRSFEAARAACLRLPRRQRQAPAIRSLLAGLRDRIQTYSPSPPPSITKDHP